MTTNETTPKMRACPFKLPEGWSRPAAHALHSHAASLAYSLYDYTGQADPQDKDPSELLRSAEFVRSLADEVMREVIEHVRAKGLTWEQIGRVFNISKQAAQQRFGG